MARRRSMVVGDRRLRRTLRRIHECLPNQLAPAMEQGADLVLQDMRSLIPRDTGAGAEALSAFVSRDGLRAEVGLRGKRARQKFFYLRFLEFGTKGYSGVLYHRADGHTVNRDRSQLSGRNRLGRRDTKVKSDGENFFGKYPNIPARPAHPFMQPAFDLNRERWLQLVRRAISRTLQSAAEGP